MPEKQPGSTSSPASDPRRPGPAADGQLAPEELIKVRLTVTPELAGQRLDHFVKARIPRLSRTRIKKMLQSQAVLGAAPRRPSTRVRSGQEIVLLRPAPVEPDVPRRYTVLYQDEHLVAIDKPAGLPVHATARYHKNTLTAVIRERHGDGPYPVLAHRLDRETSGLMLLGPTSRAGAVLKKLFSSRQIEKRYLAIVTGSPPREGVVDMPLGPDVASGIRVKMAVVDTGQPARTRYRTLERRGDFSLVEAFPETGRQHQIRVHLSALGAPVVGDKLYGPDPNLFFEYLEVGWSENLEERLLLPRQALHSTSLSFVHPGSGAPFRLTCPLAEELQDFWDDLPQQPTDGQED